MLYPKIEIANFTWKDRDNVTLILFVHVPGSCSAYLYITYSVGILFLHSLPQGVWRCLILVSSRTSLTLSLYMLLACFGGLGGAVRNTKSMGISNKFTKGVLGGNTQPGMKKTIGSLTGAATNSLEKDQAIFDDCWEQYITHKSEILSSPEQIDLFIQMVLHTQITNSGIKAKSLFLTALCLYEAINRQSQNGLSYYSQACDLINQAIRYSDESEYHKLHALLMAKVGSNSISGTKDYDEILKEFCYGQGTSSLMPDSFYTNGLNDVIKVKTNAYKQSKLSEEIRHFALNSLWNLPILLYLIYKYHIYVPPTSWFSFTWTPFYWLGIGIFGLIYLGYIRRFFGQMSKGDNIWKNEMLDLYK